MHVSKRAWKSMYSLLYMSSSDSNFVNNGRFLNFHASMVHTVFQESTQEKVRNIKVMKPRNPRDVIEKREYTSEQLRIGQKSYYFVQYGLLSYSAEKVRF